MFGVFSSQKNDIFYRKVVEFRRKVAEFYPEFRFSNLKTQSVWKIRNSAEFRSEFRYRITPGFV